MLYILIPSYRDTTLLSRCIESVDRMLKEEPYVLLVNYTHMRIGFPQAVNLLFRSALVHGDAEEIVLLSNDVEVLTEDWITQFREAASPRDVGMVGAQCCLPEKDGGWTYLVPHSEYPWYRASEEPYIGPPYETVYPPFSFCYIKPVVIENVGFLDTKFTPGYYEDYDYGLRAWMKDFRSLIQPSVHAKHLLGYTMGKIADFYPTKQAEYHMDKWGWLVKDRTPSEVLKLLKDGTWRDLLHVHVTRNRPS